MQETQADSQIPAHTNDVTGNFCSRGGQWAPGGRCPEGCDHAEHYSNDGHPECEEQIVLRDFKLTEAGQRKVEAFLAERNRG